MARKEEGATPLRRGTGKPWIDFCSRNVSIDDGFLSWAHCGGCGERRNDDKNGGEAERYANHALVILSLSRVWRLANLSGAAEGQHAGQRAVLEDHLVENGSCGMQTDQDEHQVGKKLVRFLERLAEGTVRRH